MVEERERLTSILESTSDLISTSTPGGQLTFMNRAGQTLLGWDLGADISVKQIPDVHPQWAYDIIEKEGLPIARDQGVWLGETAIIGPDGVEIPVSQVIMSHRSPDGQIEYFSTIMRDVRGQKRMEAALAASERNYRELFDKNNDGMFVHDTQGRIIDVNQAALDMTGFTREEALGNVIQDFSQGESPYSQKEAVVYVKNAYEEGPQNFEWLGKRKNGELFWAEINLKHAVIGGQNRIIATIQDVSAAKQAAEELNRYRKHLEELIRARTRELEQAQDELLKKERLAVLGQLTATVSHELRNPLGVIRSSAFYLQQKNQEKNEKIIKHLNRIEDQVEICDSIVSELLEYTRGRHSQMVVGEINPWLEQVLNELPTPNDTGINIRLEANLPKIQFDKEKMRRVIVNLIDNALQASAEQKQRKADDIYEPIIEISSTRIDTGIMFQVKDNGIGMDPETVDRAFEPLFTTRARGTGLGLANVSKIIEEHDGTVSLESKPNVGTKVMITIPAVTQK